MRYQEDHILKTKKNPRNDKDLSLDNDLLPAERTEITFLYTHDNQEEILKITDDLTKHQNNNQNVLPDDKQIKAEQQNCPYFKYIFMIICKREFCQMIMIDKKQYLMNQINMKL